MNALSNCFLDHSSRILFLWYLEVNNYMKGNSSFHTNTPPNTARSPKSAVKGFKR